MIKINDFYENKEKIIMIFLIGINLVFFYFCCILPYNELSLKNRNFENLEVKLKRFEIEKKQVEKIYKTKEIKEIELKKEYDEYREKLLQKSFKNISEFEKIIYQKIKKYGLESQVIGRVEKKGTEEKEGKVYISYEILGTDRGVKKFLTELENEEYLISMTDTPVYLETIDGECKIRLKISAYILDMFVEKDFNHFDRTENQENRKFISFEELNILEKKILNINKNLYLLLKYKKGGRDIFFENEEIEENGKKYRIKITNEGIYYLSDREIK